MPVLRLVLQSDALPPDLSFPCLLVFLSKNPTVLPMLSEKVGFFNVPMLSEKVGFINVAQLKPNSSPNAE